MRTPSLSLDKTSKCSLFLVPLGESHQAIYTTSPNTNRYSPLPPYWIKLSNCARKDPLRILKVTESEAWRLGWRCWLVEDHPWLQVSNRRRFQIADYLDHLGDASNMIWWSWVGYRSRQVDRFIGQLSKSILWLGNEHILMTRTTRDPSDFVLHPKGHNGFMNHRSPPFPRLGDICTYSPVNKWSLYSPEISAKFLPESLHSSKTHWSY